MANIKPEILPFAVDNAADCESYLFLNHPTTYMSLTSNPSEEHHSPPLSPTSTTQPILKSSTQPTNTTIATFASLPATTTSSHSMDRKSSTTSTTSTSSEDGFLGGGALRHTGNSHHLRELAELAELDQQAKAKREHITAQGKTIMKAGERGRQDWLASMMQWWPENMEMAEHEWTEEFYE